MERILISMEKSDVWVLGTPIYWWGPTAQFKTFVDRWYGVDQRQFQGKEIIAAIPMGRRDEHFARHTIGMINDICNYLGMKFVETVLAPGMNGLSSVRENTRTLESAWAAGMRIMDAY
jgi:multimeric flavodoxin WrbA